MNVPAQWVMDLPDEAATVFAATRLAGELRAGDLVTLGGDLGAGKTTFARALIRTLLNDAQAEVPSPTYTLLQSYEGPRFNIVHADLYRIGDPAELAELGWEDAAENALVLVEWAERAGEILAADRLEVHLATTGPTGAGRRLTLTGHGSFAARLARARQIQDVLDRSGFGEARRDYMLGDASVRAYERLTDEATGRKGILMIAPRRPDGPPIRLGKPYSTLVHLAESVHAFVAVGEGLRREGFSAPAIYGADLDAGLLVIEDLGPEGVIDANGPIPERYRAAVEVLAALHARDLPANLPIVPGQEHKLHRYDLEALTIEAELLLDWYYPYAAKRSPNASVRLSFVDHWVSALEPVVSGPKTWTLRDYHSPNLIWLPERAGLQKVGLIDYQDCVLGHPAYDVVSLAQDARVTVPEALELQLLAAYVRARRMADPAFDASAFTAAYALLGAQRATKILGIFIRLDRRDGKPAYLKHLPRVEGYLKRCLAHPALAKLRGWYEANLPGFAPPPEATDERNDADHPRDAAGGGPRHADAPTDG
ncbi:MAG: tRNA (adenosine(37)-N6)-threonylcarbamoyltransferase complex ATPase subunit type 1 TsaE [Beijerinckiaceae bacterium]|jgi:hypothetical protein|nr:tRNA (adenosine(37)-N6)-threonylcarbamoyltransferase complex ATPase subunit type 1 TsaE [Beijerinckiaceae bacterium]